MASVERETDERFMRMALREARKGLGRTSPNPAVGAVIVKGQDVIARGYHRKAGMPHAEIEAIQRAGKGAAGSTLYVTLEPCNHEGRTPPCTREIAGAGIKRVVAGMADPNPHVRGGGFRFLAAQGIEVTEGILEQDCARINEAFVKYVTEGSPFVSVKSALTLDGWCATSTGHSQWVSNEKSRRFVHRLRDRVDAIMVGVGTVLRDDPMLTTRTVRGRDPVRIILDTRLSTPPDAKVIDHDSRAETILVAGDDAGRGRIERLEARGVRVLRCTQKGEMIDLRRLLEILGKMQFTSILVEGGAAVIGSFLRERLVDKFYIFSAPKILGGDDGRPMATGAGPKRMDMCTALGGISTRRFGDDTLTVGYPVYKG